MDIDTSLLHELASEIHDCLCEFRETRHGTDFICVFCRNRAPAGVSIVHKSLCLGNRFMEAYGEAYKRDRLQRERRKAKRRGL
jgi:hypothetical protein